MKNREQVWVVILVALSLAVIFFTLWLYPRIGKEPASAPSPVSITAPIPKSVPVKAEPMPEAPPIAAKPTKKKGSVPQPVVDSAMTLDQALDDNTFPQKVLEQLVVVDVDYNGFDGRVHRGQFVVNQAVQQDVVDVFKEILPSGEQIERAIPIVKYKWSDSSSIRDNNSSAFNYRKKIGPGVGDSLSKHSFGRAIDINPYQNPFVAADGRKPRPYEPGTLGTIDGTSPITQAFKKRGWVWGGDWVGGKDYQHFEKL